MQTSFINQSTDCLKFVPNRFKKDLCSSCYTIKSNHTDVALDNIDRKVLVFDKFQLNFECNNEENCDFEEYHLKGIYNVLFWDCHVIDIYKDNELLCQLDLPLSRINVNFPTSNQWMVYIKQIEHSINFTEINCYSCSNFIKVIKDSLRHCYYKDNIMSNNFVVMEGWLKQIVDNTDYLVYVVLNKRTLNVYSSEESYKSNAQSAKRSVELTDKYNVLPTSMNDDNVFSVFYKGEKANDRLHLRASGREDCDQWTKQIEEVISKDKVSPTQNGELMNKPSQRRTPSPRIKYNITDNRSQVNLLSEKLKSELDQVKNELIDEKCRSRKFENTLNDVQDKLARKISELDHLSKLLKSSEENKNNLNNKITDLTKHLNKSKELEEKYELIKKEVEEFQLIKDHLKVSERENTKLKSHCSTLEQEKLAIENTLLNMQLKANKVVGEEVLQKKIDEDKSKIKILENELSKIKVENEKLNVKLKESLIIESKYKSEMETIQSNSEKLENNSADKVLEKANVIKTLTDNLNILKKQNEDISNQVTTLKRDNEKLREGENEIAKYKYQIDILKIQEKSLSNEHKSLQDNFDKMEKEMADLKLEKNKLLEDKTQLSIERERAFTNQNNSNNAESHWAKDLMKQNRQLEEVSKLMTKLNDSSNITGVTVNDIVKKFDKFECHLDGFDKLKQQLEQLQKENLTNHKTNFSKLTKFSEESLLKLNSVVEMKELLKKLTSENENENDFKRNGESNNTVKQTSDLIVKLKEELTEKDTKLKCINDEVLRLTNLINEIQENWMNIRNDLNKAQENQSKYCTEIKELTVENERLKLTAQFNEKLAQADIMHLSLVLNQSINHLSQLDLSHTGYTILINKLVNDYSTSSSSSQLTNQILVGVLQHILYRLLYEVCLPVLNLTLIDYMTQQLHTQSPVQLLTDLVLHTTAYLYNWTDEQKNQQKQSTLCGDLSLAKLIEQTVQNHNNTDNHTNKSVDKAAIVNSCSSSSTEFIEIFYDLCLLIGLIFSNKHLSSSGIKLEIKKELPVKFELTDVKVHQLNLQTLKTIFTNDMSKELIENQIDQLKKAESPISKYFGKSYQDLQKELNDLRLENNDLKLVIEQMSYELISKTDVDQTNIKWSEDEINQSIGLLSLTGQILCFPCQSKITEYICSWDPLKLSRELFEHISMFIDQFDEVVRLINSKSQYQSSLVDVNERMIKANQLFNEHIKVIIAKLLHLPKLINTSQDSITTKDLNSNTDSKRNVQ